MSGFFFDDDDKKPGGPPPKKVHSAAESSKFFSALESAGLISEEPPSFFDAVKAAQDTANTAGTLTPKVLAKMKKLRTQYLEIDFGIYEGNYAVHITPVNEKKNLSGLGQVEAALKAAILALNEVVPYQLEVKIHPPKPDWKLKVISFVIEKGATAWNLNTEDLEQKTIPKMFDEIQKIILGL